MADPQWVCAHNKKSEKSDHDCGQVIARYAVAELSKVSVLVVRGMYTTVNPASGLVCKSELNKGIAAEMLLEPCRTEREKYVSEQTA